MLCSRRDDRSAQSFCLYCPMRNEKEQSANRCQRHRTVPLQVEAKFLNLISFGIKQRHSNQRPKSGATQPQFAAGAPISVYLACLLPRGPRRHIAMDFSFFVISLKRTPDRLEGLRANNAGTAVDFEHFETMASTAGWQRSTPNSPPRDDPKQPALLADAEMIVSGQGCSANFRRYANQRTAAAWRRCTELDLRRTR